MPGVGARCVGPNKVEDAMLLIVCPDDPLIHYWQTD